MGVPGVINYFQKNKYDYFDNAILIDGIGSEAALENIQIPTRGYVGTNTSMESCFRNAHENNNVIEGNVTKLKSEHRYVVQNSYNIDESNDGRPDMFEWAFSQNGKSKTKAEPVAEPVTEPVIEPEIEQVTEPVTEPVAENELIDKIGSSVNSAFDILTNTINKLNNTINETSEKYEIQKDLNILNIEKIKEILNKNDEGSIGKDDITILNEFGKDIHANKEAINEMLYSVDYAKYLAEKSEISTDGKSDREILEELAIKFGVDEEKMSTNTDQKLVEEIVNRYKTQLAQASGTDILSEDKGVEPTTEVETEPEPVREVTTEVQLEPEPVTEPEIEQVTEPVTEPAIEPVIETLTKIATKVEPIKKIGANVISNIDILTRNIEKWNNQIYEIIKNNKITKDLATPKLEKENTENPPQYPKQDLNKPSSNTGSVPTVDNELNSILKAAENFANETSSSKYICSVLHQAGYLTEEQLNEYKNYIIDDIFKKFDELGWKKITNINNFQVGDVVLIDNNGEKIVQIYAGDNKWYVQGKSETQELSSDYFENLNWQAYTPQK